MKQLDDLIGGPEGLSADEYARLRDVHELLLEVPAPPDVPRRPRPAAVSRLRQRRSR